LSERQRGTRISPIPAAVFFDEFAVRKPTLGILVQSLHVRVRRSRIQIEVILLHILTMVAFIARKAKEAFFEDRIAAIPESQREAHELMPVGDAHNSVFAPTKGARAGMVVGKEIPSGAVRAVVFAYCAPLAFGKVRSPALAMDLALS
jgi:hypothetical protein